MCMVLAGVDLHGVSSVEAARSVSVLCLISLFRLSVVSACPVVRQASYGGRRGSTAHLNPPPEVVEEVQARLRATVADHARQLEAARGTCSHYAPYLTALVIMKPRPIITLRETCMLH
jgi:hypothetical protein